MSTTVVTEDRPTTEPVPPRPSRTRRTATVLAIAGIGVAVLLLVLGTAMKSNADFSEDYVARQLSAQRITFKSTETLTDQEKQTPCLVKYAGESLTTGKQAECYANNFIGVHLGSVAGGKTYSEMREVQTNLRTQIADAQAKGDPALADLQRQLADVSAKRQTLFEGESTRGMLLTAYGFSTLGTKADQASGFAYGAGVVVLLLSLVLLARAMVSRR